MSSETNVAGKPPRDAEAFVYRPVGTNPHGADGRASGANNEISPAVRAEIAKREQEARQKGFAEGQSSARAEDEKRIEEIRASIANALKDFARAREDYFARVEGELVQLSLSIAKKILSREAFIDPMLLTGLVHVALEKMGQETKARLRTHPSQIASWREHFQQSPASNAVPELIGDESLDRTQCVLETELGSTEISLEGHLKEIEQGFFDLLAQRPRSA